MYWGSVINRSIIYVDDIATMRSKAGAAIWLWIAYLWNCNNVSVNLKLAVVVVVVVMVLPVLLYARETWMPLNRPRKHHVDVLQVCLWRILSI